MSPALNLDSHGTSGAPKSRVRVLVTGASGKIGKHVVSELVARGYAVLPFVLLIHHSAFIS